MTQNRLCFSRLIFALLLIGFQNLYAQGQYYILNGLTVLNCDNGPYTYYLETDEVLLSTEWTITPPNGAQILDSDLFSALITFSAPGLYTLLASSDTENGSSLRDTLLIVVQGVIGGLEVGGCYEINPDTACYMVCAFSQSIIHFPDSNAQWTIQGAESYEFINETTIEVTWGAGGSGTITYYENQCTAGLCFEILPEPVADFSTLPASAGDTLTVCLNQEVYFENKSFNGLGYIWLFGDGAQSESFDASHHYSAEGFYTVTLRADGICDCGDEKQFVIEVLPAPAPSLDCVNSVCPETRQRYTATTNGCTTYNWSISPNGTIVNGGGASDDFIEVIWHEGPDGIIQLSVSGCQTEYCSFVNTFRVPIITPDGPMTGDAAVCAGEVVMYDVPYFPGTTYDWQVGPFGTIVGGQNTNGVTVLWQDVSNTSFSSVSVQYNNCFLECNGEAAMTVAITPEIYINGDAQVCRDGNASVQALAGFITPLPANVNWHIEDEAGQIIYTAAGPSSVFTHTFSYPPGVYQWVATNTSSSYCTEEIRKKIQVTATPLTPLGINGELRICPGQPYGYTIVAAGNYSTLWTITDGNSTYNYEGQACQHVFGSTPPYIVQAIHADIQFQACISDPISITLSTVDELVINGISEACYNGIDEFTTEYISGAEYNWEVIPSDHGEIKRSDKNNVEVFWTQSGNVTLRLTACGITVEKVINVHPLPTFTVNGPFAACANEQVTISTSQPLLAHAWINSNDIVFSFENNVDLSPGSYGVELIDNFGCSSEKSFQISSFPAPTVHLSTASEDNFCTTLPAGIEIVANTDGAGYNFSWYKDDVLIGPGGPIFSVTDFGSYHVEVSNQYGCKAVSEKISFVDCCAPNTCGFSFPGFPSGCAVLPHDFNISVTETLCNSHQFAPLVSGIVPGTVYWYIRSISEGVIAEIHSDVLDYTYQKPGYYHISMIALVNGFPYNSSVCAHAQKLNDIVPAVADFSYSGLCASDVFSFEDLTTFLPGETIASWNWNFGDPFSGASNNSTEENPTHVFSSAGSFEVTLTVTMASGCSTSVKHTITASPGPTLMPQYDMEFCEKEALAFELPGNLYEIEWGFDDPGSGIENSAISDSVFHTYNTPGTYTVTLTASDINGCANQVNFLVDIKPNLLGGTIQVDPNTTICAGDTVILTSPPGGQTWSWSTGESTPQISVTESNQYDVLIHDQYQCSYSPPPVFIEVIPTPVVTIQGQEILGPGVYGLWESSLHICEGTEFQIQAFASGSVIYHWFDGSTDESISFTDEAGTLPMPGIYYWTVVVEDTNNGCISAIDTIVVEIFALPNIPIVALTSGNGCGFNENIIQVTNVQPGIIYQWSDGQEGSSITATHSGHYYVTAIDPNGCSRQGNSVEILPSAAVDQIAGGCFVACDPLTVCLPPLSNVASYTIFQNGSPYASGTSWPDDFLITEDGTYTIEVTASNGCIATSDPLDIILYTGVGSITVVTYLDVDGDGMITGADALLPNIPVQISSDDGLHVGMTYTDAGAQFVFEDYPATGYLASFNQSLLSSQWIIVIDSVSTEIVTCDDSVVVSLLLKQNCTVTGPDQQFELCPGEMISIGDSSWTDPGIYTMHLPSAQGCDSTFQVEIIIPDSFNITAYVWLDADGNGVVSPGDNLLPGIPIIIDNLTNIDAYNLVTNGSGSVSGEYPVDDYSVHVDTFLLNDSLLVVIWNGMVSDTACGSITFDFLLSSICQPIFRIQNHTICSGDSLLVQGQWITTAGVYSFILSDTLLGCDTLLDVYVDFHPPIVIEDSITWNCMELGTIILSVEGAGPFVYEWSNQLPGDSIVSGLQGGSYTVTITDINGCTASENYFIQESPVLDFYLDPYYEMSEGDTIEIIIGGDISVPGLQFNWYPDSVLSCPVCSSTLAFPTSNILLTVEITDSDSCLYVLETEIFVTPDTQLLEDHIYVPNVFSPNGDGYNDHWTIFSRLENTYVHSLVLYDRWGELLLSKEEFILNTFEGWDGTLNGKTLNPGVYAYTAVLTLGDGNRRIVKGDVTLLR